MKKNRFWTVGRIARIGVLGALSAILYNLPGIPIIPPIYKLDFSTVPALLAGFSLGPVSGLLVTLIKDVVGLTTTSSMGVGEIADFLMSGTFVVLASLIYRQTYTRKAAIVGMAFGTAAMAIVGAATNYWIMIPFYSTVMHMEVAKIVGMVAKTIPAVDSLWKLILLAVVPFNLFKGVVLAIISGLMYRYVAALLGDGKVRK